MVAIRRVISWDDVSIVGIGFQKIKNYDEFMATIDAANKETNESFTDVRMNCKRMWREKENTGDSHSLFGEFKIILF